MEKSMKLKKPETVTDNNAQFLSDTTCNCRLHSSRSCGGCGGWKHFSIKVSRTYRAVRTRKSLRIYFHPSTPPLNIHHLALAGVDFFLYFCTVIIIKT